MEIRLATDQDAVIWDAYFTDHPLGNIHHLWSWRRLVQRVHRHKPYYLMAFDQGRMIGGLPMFHVKSMLGGSVFVATAGAVVAGLLADNEAVEIALVEKAKEVVINEKGAYLNMRQYAPLTGNLTVDDRFANIRIPLTEEDQHFKALRSDTRRCLRRGLDQNFEIDTEKTDVAAFYKLYSDGMRRMGTPVEGFQWINGIFEELPRHHFIASVRLEGKIILTKMMRTYKDQMYPVISHTEAGYKQLYPEHALAWAMMNRARSEGLKYYNFGRSMRDGGAYKFKMGWIGEEERLYYHYFLNLQKDMPDLSQQSGTRQKAARMWQKLPTPVANWLGPKIRRCYL